MSSFNCPACGTALVASVTGAVGSKWSKMQSFNLGAASSGVAEWTRTTPTRAPTPSGDVVVPLAQSAITGLVVAIAGAVVAYVQHWPWWAALGAFAAAFALSWFWLLSDHRSLLRVTETMTSEDARPAAESQAATRFEITEHNGPNSDTMRFMDLPVSEAVLCHIARGVLAGHPFSERAWGGRGKPMSGPKFRQLQDALLGAGYIRWASDADHRQGVALTRKGEALFRQAADVGIG